MFNAEVEPQTIDSDGCALWLLVAGWFGSV